MGEIGNKRQLKSIGQRVKFKREEMELTQEEYADKFGYARTTLAKLEAGLRDFKSTEIVKLAVELGVSCDYLLGRKTAAAPDEFIQAVVEKLGITEKAAMKLLHTTRRISTKSKSSVKQIPSLSEIIESKEFSNLIMDIDSMDAINTSRVTNARAIILQKVLGQSELWEFYRQRVVKSIDDIITSIAPKPKDEEGTIRDLNFTDFENYGVDEKEAWSDFVSGKTDGSIEQLKHNAKEV